MFFHTENPPNLVFDYSLKVRVAFVELYKETLYDLLSSKGKKEDCAVDLREDPKSGVKIVNLTEVWLIFNQFVIIRLTWTKTVQIRKSGLYSNFQC